MKVFWSFCYYLDSTAQLRKFLSNVSVRVVQASCEVSIKVFADVTLVREDDKTDEIFQMKLFFRFCRWLFQSFVMYLRPKTISSMLHLHVMMINRFFQVFRWKWLSQWYHRCYSWRSDESDSRETVTRVSSVPGRLLRMRLISGLILFFFNLCAFVYFFRCSGGNLKKHDLCKHTEFRVVIVTTEEIRNVFEEQTSSR